eukprot:CAMPEP_0182549886 /NCGR_PEP_ID=MMETSP1323-20130603/40833_1 /TAXON_ID=236787 /ORGANISM="Florenciella parvula, Strain RCC1693" /LENGTH=46 /DNA_ID= /DNA_START= /DNA_END= /DNA_ORIENTATION=
MRIGGTSVSRSALGPRPSTAALSGVEPVASPSPSAAGSSPRAGTAE